MAGYLFLAAWEPSVTYSAFLGGYFVEKGTLTIREEILFTVNAGESFYSGRSDDMLAWGISGRFKFYWLHFELTAAAEKTAKRVLMPQHTALNDPQYMTALFRQFLHEQENVHRSVALECILLLILQQISASARESRG
jgi:hypothetical protein